MMLAALVLAATVTAPSPEPLQVGVYQLQARTVPPLAPALDEVRQRGIPSNKRLAIEYGALLGADLLSTEAFLANGYDELVWRGGRAVRVVGTAAVYAFVLWSLDWLADHDEAGVARWIRRLHIAARTFAIGSNLRLALGPHADGR